MSRDLFAIMRYATPALLLLTLLLPSARGDDGVDYFEKKVRPVFVEHCHSCHSAEKTKGGLWLDT
ncbi:MAG: hypothetical protein ABGY75_00005, partial [Gemmataceae bacterium]